jgi:hypothetical protein
MERTTKEIEEIKEANHTQDLPLSEIIAEKRIDLALQNINRDLIELTEKMRKPREQVQYVADNWRRWRQQALIGAGVVAVGVAAIIVGRKMLK